MRKWGLMIPPSLSWGRILTTTSNQPSPTLTRSQPSTWLLFLPKIQLAGVLVHCWKKDWCWGNYFPFDSFFQRLLNCMHVAYQKFLQVYTQWTRGCCILLFLIHILVKVLCKGFEGESSSFMRSLDPIHLYLATNIYQGTGTTNNSQLITWLDNLAIKSKP